MSPANPLGQVQAPTATPSVFRKEYVKVADELKSQWQKRNRYEVPKLCKIVVNVGMGKAHEDSGYRDLVIESLTHITGQRPAVTHARKSIAAFKLRAGMEVGAKVTLRGRRMEDFFTRLVHIVLPRVRDFRGLSRQGFDGHGNYSLGLTEHTVFPEISSADVTRTHPLEASIVTTARDDDEAYEVLKRLGFPFITEQKKSPKEASDGS